MTNSTNSSAIVGQIFENGSEHVELLPATNDDHGGVIVDMKEAMNSEAFQVLLRASISQWRQQVLSSLPPKATSFIELVLHSLARVFCLLVWLFHIFVNNDPSNHFSFLFYVNKIKLCLNVLMNIQIIFLAYIINF